MSGEIRNGEQQLAIVVHQAGEPQHALASFVRLMMNYQYGLGVIVARNMREAATQLNEQGDTVRCVFVIQDHERNISAIAPLLHRGGVMPLFCLCPDNLLSIFDIHFRGIENIFVCPWKKVFMQTGQSLHQVVSGAFADNGIERLLGESGGGKVASGLSSLLKNMNTLPTLPVIVLRILRLINDPQSTVDDLEKVLISDPAVVHKLIQVVNSPIFTGEGRRTKWTLKEAIVRLGRREVGTIAQQIKLVNSFVKPENSGFDLRRFWIHSVGCAVLADKLYSRKLIDVRTKLDFNDYWTGALLHDIGKLVLGSFFWSYFDEVGRQLAQDDIRDFRQAEARLGDVADHERIGQLLLMKGKMAPGLIEAVATHHTVQPSPKALVCLIHMADNMSKELGLGYFAEEQPVYSPEVTKALRLSTAQVKDLSRALGANTLDEINELVDQCLAV
jgi:HD-like signal output (HDOD) protein